MANIYKRGNNWWGRVQHHGRDLRQSLKTNSKHVAQKRLREWIDRLEGASWGDQPRRTFDEAMESFILNHLPNLRPQSRRRYISSARMLTPHFEGQFLDKITSSTMSDFETYRRREGASSPTIRRDLACLSSMFTHCIVDLEWLELNPVPTFLKRQSRRGRLKESPPRTRYLSQDEEDALLAAAAPGLADQIAFAIDTGLRLEEQLGMTWDRVNLARKEVTIPAAKAKGKKDRTVPLLPRSAQILAQLPRRIRLAGGQDWVFCKTDGTRYGKRTKGLAGACSRAEVKSLKWHDLRRTCGCRLLQNYNMRLEEVRDWLGHSTVAQTERAYAFLTIDQLHKKINPGTKPGTRLADSKYK